MSRVFLNNNAINQKGTPLLYTDILSNRPQYGINGRLFFSTDSQQIFEDTGTSWLLLADATGSVSGYVPYVGATTNLNLGLFNITASSLITNGGTSSQFVKGNGTLDSTAYVSLTSFSGNSPIQYNNTTGVISILQSNTSQSGYLSSTDWNTFNNKAGLASFSATTPLSYNSGTGAFSIQVANTGQSGYLTNTDWNTFNNKQTALTFGNLTETSSSILNITGGTGAVIGSGTTIAVNQANSTQSGYLSSTDWNTFNNKQATITLTTTGTSGAATLISNTLNIPNTTYTLPTATSTVLGGVKPDGTSILNTAGVISVTNTSIGSQPQLSGTGFVKATGTTISYDNSTYLTTTTAGTTYVPYTGATGAVNLGTNNIYLSSIGSGISSLSSWGAIAPMIEGLSTSISQYNTSTIPVLYLNANAYYNGTNWIYKQSNYASYLYLGGYGISPAFQLQTTNTLGTAGATATFNPVFSIAQNGNITTNGTASLTLGSSSGTGTGYLYAGAATFSSTIKQSVGTNTFNTTSGNTLIGSTTDNGKKLQVNGTTTTSGFSASGATYTVSATVSEQYYHVFTGAVGQTLTLLSPSSNNLQYVIINNSANTLTVAAAASTNIINTVGSSVSTITLIANQRVFVIADGNNKYYQIF